MVGFAQAVVVVEARKASGSLITAEFAQEANRDLAAVPGPVNARIAAGSNALLHQGAAFVRGAEDVLDLVFGVGQGPRPSSAHVAVEPQLQKILDAIEVGDPVGPAGERAGFTSGDVRAALGRLEALGLVRRDMFGGYERTGVPARCT
jgi:predicted Rossmann fold nucleotide-binding protein DprA/Smf involved in DNA uptake